MEPPTCSVTAIREPSGDQTAGRARSRSTSRAPASWTRRRPRRGSCCASTSPRPRPHEEEPPAVGREHSHEPLRDPPRLASERRDAEDVPARAVVPAEDDRGAVGREGRERVGPARERDLRAVRQLLEPEAGRSAPVRDERERPAVGRDRRLRVAAGVRQGVERRAARPAARGTGRARGGAPSRARGAPRPRPRGPARAEPREAPRTTPRCPDVISVRCSERCARSRARSRVERVAVVGVLREAAVRDPARRGGRLRRGGGERLVLVADDRGERLGGRVLLEGAASGEHLVEDRAERELVRAEVRRPSGGLLGRHVADRAHHGARLRRARGLRDGFVLGVAERRERLREAEVEELRAPLLRHDHVLGLEVAVDDSRRVRRREGVRDLRGDRERAAERHGLGEDGAQRAAFDELHGENVTSRETGERRKRGFLRMSRERRSPGG